MIVQNCLRTNKVDVVCASARIRNDPFYREVRQAVGCHIARVVCVGLPLSHVSGKALASEPLYHRQVKTGSYHNKRA